MREFEVAVVFVASVNTPYSENGLPLAGDNDVWLRHFGRKIQDFSGLSRRCAIRL